MADNSIISEKIKYIIKKYKEDFATRDKEERYKWIAVKHYKDNWDIDAEDFPKVIADSFIKADNLLRATMYWPYGTLTEYAKNNTDSIRKLFKNLYNEDLPFTERYEEFRAAFEAYYKPQGKKHFQDLHAVSVYLMFQFPEKHYIYKSTMFDTFAKRIEYGDGKANKGTDAEKLENYYSMCNLVLEELKQDKELINMSKARLNDMCYQDEELHMLTMDIVYFGGVAMKDKDFNKYWPTLDVYNPSISKERWLDLLADKNITNEKCLRMLNIMMTMGGEATCAKIAELYGDTYNSYNALGLAFAKKVYNATNCPLYTEGNKTRYYTIPFVGRDVKEDGMERYSLKLRDELLQALKEMNLPEPAPVAKVIDSKREFEKNIILYGPPGTGKSYNSVIYAVAIVENKSLDEVKIEEYSDILARYKKYKDEGKIEFTTFHQSYGYEEFIEGIKPTTEPVEDEDEKDSAIEYIVKPGVFKKFCDQAQRIDTLEEEEDFGLNKDPKIWKVSLMNAGDNPVRTECLKEGHIRIGWDEYGKDIVDYAEVKGKKVKRVLDYLMNTMQIGDIVLSCYSAKTIDAIGVVTGEYEWHDEYNDYKRLRKVKWIVKGINEDIYSLNGNYNLTLQTIYELKNIGIKDVYNLIAKYTSKKKPNKKDAINKYVFIIDEINRGNISKIFGELITLIEPVKRLGEEEEMKALLPYSNKPFGVPSNVYILGTMNTADRSIALMDTALRRRFKFEEMMPDNEVIAGLNIDGIDIAKMLDTMNERIAILYDREHTIGHAFFTPLLKPEAKNIKVLGNIFAKSIIPLLQEYFYEDYSKIQLVLGDNAKTGANSAYKFIADEKVEFNKLFLGSNDDLDLPEKQYKINADAFKEPKSYKGIYEELKNE